MTDLSELGRLGGVNRWQAKDGVRKKAEYDLVARLFNVTTKSVRQEMRRRGFADLAELIDYKYTKKYKMKHIAGG